jgi:hypothetical protein
LADHVGKRHDRGTAHRNGAALHMRKDSRASSPGASGE